MTGRHCSELLPPSTVATLLPPNVTRRSDSRRQQATEEWGGGVTVRAGRFRGRELGARIFFNPVGNRRIAIVLPDAHVGGHFANAPGGCPGSKNDSGFRIAAVHQRLAMSRMM